MKQRFSVAVTLSMLAVFASGVAAGVLGHQLYAARSVYSSAPTPAAKKETPEQWRKKFVGEMQTRLKLDDGQVNKLNTILDETRDKFRAEKGRSHTEMKNIHDGQVANIKAMLSDVQRPEYDKVLQEQERKRKEREAADKKQQR